MRFFTLIAVVMLVGCSSASQTATATTRPVVVTTTAAPTTTTEAPTTAVDPDIAEIEAVVTGYLVFLSQLDFATASADLDAFATGEYARQVRSRLDELASNGTTAIVGKGANSVTSLEFTNADMALVVVCYLDDGGLQSADGEIVSVPDEFPLPFTIEVANTDTGWRITSFESPPESTEPCEL